MKKIFISLCASTFLGVSSLFAVPARSIPMTVTQPDGSVVTVKLVGDEFSHYRITSDGIPVIRCADGFYRYAELSPAGQAVAGAVIARDAALRHLLRIRTGILRRVAAAEARDVDRLLQLVRRQIDGRCGDGGDNGTVVPLYAVPLCGSECEKIGSRICDPEAFAQQRRVAFVQVAERGVEFMTAAEPSGRAAADLPEIDASLVIENPDFACNPFRASGL